MNTVLKCAVVVCLSLFSLSAMGNADDQHCGNLTVQLATPPGQQCTLEDYELIHGRFLLGSAVPVSITSTPASFQIGQIIKGPDIRLHYRCGSKAIELKAQQDACVLQAGAITATSSSPETHVNTAKGSFLWGTHGTVSWVVQ